MSAKKQKIPRRKSLVAIKILTILNVIATMLLSSLFLLTVLMEDLDVITKQFGNIPEAVLVLLFPITILMVIIFVLIYGIKYILLTIPSIITLAMGIPTSICVGAIAKKGTYAYAYKNSSAVTVSIVLQVLNGISSILFGAIFLDEIAGMILTNGTYVTLPSEFNIMFIVTGVISLFIAFLLLCDTLAGRSKLKKHGIKTEKEVEKENKILYPNGFPPVYPNQPMMQPPVYDANGNLIPPNAPYQQNPTYPTNADLNNAQPMEQNSNIIPPQNYVENIEIQSSSPTNLISEQPAETILEEPFPNNTGIDDLPDNE